MPVWPYQTRNPKIFPTLSNPYKSSEVWEMWGKLILMDSTRDAVHKKGGCQPIFLSNKHVHDLFDWSLVEPFWRVWPKIVAWGRVYLTVLCALSIELVGPVNLRPWGASESIPVPSNVYGRVLACWGLADPKSPAREKG